MKQITFNFYKSPAFIAELIRDIQLFKLALKTVIAESFYSINEYLIINIK